MVLAFLISLGGCWGALMALGTFGIVLWNGLAEHMKKEKLVVRMKKKTLAVICAAISLVFNTVYFIAVLT